MSARWIRTPAGTRQSAASTVVAGTVAAVAGAVTFYLTRLVLSREPVGPDTRPGRPRQEQRGSRGA